MCVLWSVRSACITQFYYGRLVKVGQPLLVCAYLLHTQAGKPIHDYVCLKLLVNADASPARCYAVDRSFKWHPYLRATCRPDRVAEQNRISQSSSPHVAPPASTSVNKCKRVVVRYKRLSASMFPNLRGCCIFDLHVRCPNASVTLTVTTQTRKNRTGHSFFSPYVDCADLRGSCGAGGQVEVL